MKTPNVGNVLETIRAVQGTLRPSEQQVAALVLDEPNFVINASLAAVAEAVSVSTPTVMRFCQALGLSGFQALKIHLAQSLALGGTALADVIDGGDSVTDVAKKIFDFHISSLDRVRRGLDGIRLAQAIDALARAKRIEFYGVGASGVVARDAQQKFPLFGVPCVSYVDGHLQAMSASILTEDDVVVAISHTGRSQEILLAAELASDAGAPTIAITGRDTPLSKVCSIALILDSLDNTDVYTPTISRIAALVAIDLLATGVALRRRDGYRDQLRKVKQGLERKRVIRRKWEG